MKKYFLFGLLFLLVYSAFSQKIFYKTTVLDSLEIHYTGFFPSLEKVYSIKKHENKFLVLDVHKQNYLEFDSKGKELKRINFEEKQKVYVVAMNIWDDKILFIDGKDNLWQLNNEKINKLVSVKKKFGKQNFYEYSFYNNYSIAQSFVVDDYRHLYVIAVHDRSLVENYENLGEKEYELSSFAFLNEKGKIFALAPNLSSPYHFLKKYLPFDLQLYSAYNQKKGVFYYTSSLNHDIKSLDSTGSQLYSFGQAAENVTFKPIVDSSYENIKEFSIDLVKQYEHFQDNYFNLRFDPHYNVLFRSYIKTSKAYKEKFKNALQKVPKACGIPVTKLGIDELPETHTQIYTPEGKYIGTIKDHERYTPLLQNVIHQEGNIYWIRGPITYGKWTIYKVKMDLEVESLEK